MKRRNELMGTLVDCYCESSVGRTHGELRGLFQYLTRSGRKSDDLFSVNMFLWRALEQYDRRKILGGQLRGLLKCVDPQLAQRPKPPSIRELRQRMREAKKA